MDKGARLWSCVSGVQGSEKEHTRQGHMRPVRRVRSSHSSGRVRYLHTADHVYHHLSEAAGSAPPRFPSTRALTGGGRPPPLPAARVRTLQLRSSLGVLGLVLGFSSFRVRLFI